MNNETINVGFNHTRTFTQKDEQSSPIEGSMYHVADNIIAMGVAIEKLETRLKHVIRAKEDDDGAAMDAVRAPEGDGSSLYKRLELQRQRLAFLIDTVESITRRLEV